MQNGSGIINVSDIPTFTHCSLGRWYYGIGKRQFGERQEFLAIEDQHKKFHEFLKEYVEIFNSKNGSKSQAVLNQLELVSIKVVNLLDQLKEIDLTVSIDNNKHPFEKEYLYGKTTGNF